MKLSVILPIYNEDATLAPLFARLVPVLEQVVSDWEIIAIDDGSQDDSMKTLQALRRQMPQVRVIKFSRNFGKEAALAAGLQAAMGARVLIMDSDLQHPPELIPQMMDLQCQGADVVYGVRGSRQTESWVRRLCGPLFYRVFSRAAEVPIPMNGSDFRLLSRRCVDALNALPERVRFMKGLYAWVGYRQKAVYYDVEARRSGSSKWSLLRLFSYAWSGIVSFSVIPLRVWSLIGSVIAGFSVLYAVWITLETLIFGRDLPGYATLAVAIFFLGGLQLISIGVLGEYIARIFAETKQRPLFVIEERHGFEDLD
ncbi:MAG: glycosyltransferase family 2 protein [Pseudomonadota bacterium]